MTPRDALAAHAEVLLEVPRDQGRAVVVLRRMADLTLYVSIELDRGDRLAAVGWKADELDLLSGAIAEARRQILGHPRHDVGGGYACLKGKP